MLTGFLAAGCGTPAVPHVGLRPSMYAGQQGRAIAEAELAKSEADLRAGGIGVVARAVRDYCSEWANIQDISDHVDAWGVQCSVEEDLYGGFDDYSSFVRTLESRLRQAGWPQLGAKAIASYGCGDYSRGSETGVRNLGVNNAGVSLKIPLPSDSLNLGWLRVEVATTGIRSLRRNVQYMLGCVGCGPDAIPNVPDTYANLLAYVQHACPSSGKLMAQLRPWKYFFRLSYLDGEYFWQEASGANTLSPPGRTGGQAPTFNPFPG